MNEETNRLNNSLKILAKSSILILFGAIFSKVITLFYRVVIARYFEPEVYGLFSLALMISGLFIAISSMGLNAGLLRYISLYRAKKDISKIRHVLLVSSLFLLFTSTLSALLLFSLSELISVKIFNNTDLIIFLKIFSISIPLGVFMQLFLSIILAYEMVKWYTGIFHFLNNFIKLVSLLALIFIGLGSNAITLSYILGLLASCITLYIVSKYYISEIFGRYHLSKKER